MSDGYSPNIKDVDEESGSVSGLPADEPSPQLVDPMQPFPPVSEKKPMRKGLVAGIVGGIVALVAIIVVIIVVVLQTRISATDYATMGAHVSKIKAAYSTVADNVAMEMEDTRYSTTDSAADTLDSASSDLKKIETMSRQMESLKAFKDTDVSTQYSAMTKKIASYKKYVEAASENIPVLKKSITVCNADSSSDADEDDPAAQVAALDSDLGKCQTELDKVAKLSDKDIAQFGTDFGKSVASVKSTTAKMKALGSKSTIENSTKLVNKFNTLSSQLNKEIASLNSVYTDSEETLSDAIEKSEKAADASSAISTMATLLQKKQLEG